MLSVASPSHNSSDAQCVHTHTHTLRITAPTVQYNTSAWGGTGFQSEQQVRKHLQGGNNAPSGR